MTFWIIRFKKKSFWEHLTHFYSKRCTLNMNKVIMYKVDKGWTMHKVETCIHQRCNQNSSTNSLDIYCNTSYDNHINTYLIITL